MAVQRAIPKTLVRAGITGAVLIACLLLTAPAASAAGARCGGRQATIVKGGGDNVIRAPKRGVQVIVAGGGDDLILARRNKDVVCAGPGDDEVFAGPGRDRVFGNSGRDVIFGEAGSDRLSGGRDGDRFVGGAGGDVTHGGLGDDRLFGGIQDDQLVGGLGNDLLAGEHGIDLMDGGDGNDWMRGDVNRDRFIGGTGSDTASFATATPPGPDPVRHGVDVNLRSGLATGDDSPERLFRVENLVGSPFADTLIGIGGAVSGGGGADACSGFPEQVCDPLHRPGSLAIAYVVDQASPDPGLVILGGTGDDNVSVSVGDAAITVSGALAGPGCVPDATGQLICAKPPTELGYLLFWGDAGNDTFDPGAAVSPFTLVKADGGPGDDSIRGGPNADLLYGGETGSDSLDGGPGDDALVGRPGGGDILSGGPGNDNLVSDDPCAGHTYIGGPGRGDIAGFGHVTLGGVRARLDGFAVLRGSPVCTPTRIAGSELIEGSRNADVLIGTKGFNLLVGREGNDRLFGGGGFDDFRGDAGMDRCLGRGKRFSC